MEYNLWKSVLLDWVNSTGFLVQNYENLGDTEIDTFFIAFKKQIKSTQIKSENVISFVRDYYKDFYMKLDGKDKVPLSEYVYFYSLFLHFACVLHADTGVQQICNNMVRKNQELIEKYLDYLFKIGKCERAIVQSAIEEAENYDVSVSHVSPITRNLQSVLSNKSPQTPKSKMLNTWNLENRNLKAQLETERFERGYLEMQLNQCEKKLIKLDEDYKEAITENHLLRKQIQTLDEGDHINQNAQTEVTVKQLRREINEKEDELLKLTITCNESKDDIEILKEKLQYAESQIKFLNDKLLDSFSEAESFKIQLDEREKMISYVNTNNKELSDMLKELQSNSKKLDFDSSASYELLNSTANDLNTSSFCVMEENLANAVVDIRLIDQQRQNMALNESINRLQNELTNMQDETTKLYKIMNESIENGVEPPSSTDIFSIINSKYTETVEKNKELSQKIESHCSEITLLNEQTSSLQSTIDELNEKLQLEERENENLLSQNQNTMIELENIKTALNNCETQKSELAASLLDSTSQLEQIQSEKRELIAKHFDELRHIRMELEEKINVLNATQNDLDTANTEKNSLASKVFELNRTIDELTQQMVSEKEQCTKIQAETAEKVALILKEKEAIEEKLEKVEVEVVDQRKQFDNLVQENEVLTIKVEQYTKDIQGLQDSMTKLQNENEINKEQLIDQQQQNLALNESISRLQNELTILQDEATKIYKIMNEPSENGVEPKSSTAIFSAINSKYTETVEKNKELLQKIESKCSDITLLNEQTSNLQSTIDAMNERLQLEERENENLLSQNQNTMVELEIIKTALNNCETQKSVLTASLSDATTHLEQTQSEKRELIAKHFDEQRHIRMELEEKIKVMNAVQNDLVVANKEKNSLASKVLELNHTIVELTQQMVVEKEESTEKQAETAEKLALITKEKEAIGEKLEKIEAELVDQRKQFDNLVQENEVLTAKVEQYTKDIEELQDSLTKLQSENKVLLESTTNKELELATNKEQLIDQQRQNLTLNESIGKLQNELTTLQDEATKLYKTTYESSESSVELPSSSAVFSAIKSKYSELVDINKELSQKIESHCSEITLLNERTSSLQRTIDALNEKLQLEEKENENLLSQNKNTMAELENIKAALSNCETQKSELTTSLLNLTSQLEAIQSEKRELIAKHSDELYQVRMELEEKINMLNAENLTLNESISRLQNELTILQDEATKIYKIMNESSEIDVESPSPTAIFSKINSKYSEIIDKNKELLQKIENNCSEITLFNEQTSSLQITIDALNERLQLEEKENGNLLSQNRNTIAELEKVKTALNNCETQKSELAASLSDSTSQLEQIQSEKQELISKHSDELRHIQMELEEKINIMNATQNDLVTANTEKNSLVSKVIQLNRTIDELTQQMVAEKEESSEKQAEITEKLALIHKEKGEIEEKLEKVEAEVVDQRKQFDNLVQENEVLTIKVEQYTKDIEGLQDSLTKLQSENKVLLESATNKEQILTLNEQLVRMEKNCNEKFELWKKERESLMQDVRIFKAKLMKEREAHEQNDREFKIMKNNYEEKLEKMKEKMKSLYKEEMAKVQDKHEKQLAELITENRKYADKLIFYDDKTKEFSSQIHALNEEKLQLLKEHEIMKSKLRTYEIGTTLNGGNNTTGASKFFDKIRGGNFRMEDEEGELFDNTYLDELKRGSLTGRESLTFEEIQRRNSMVPPHLRSSYMPQFADNEPKTNENTFKSLDDSMFSTQSESRRGTAYKRPGPPTPSKHGGRLSLGGGDASRGDVLREQNGVGRPSVGGNTSKASKKITPGKLSRIFSTSKLKDEDKENDHQTAGRNTLHQLQKLFFSTSTPRHRNVRRSSMSKFETTSSFGLANDSISTIDSKHTTESKRLSSLSRNLLAQTRRVSQKILCSLERRPANVDSTPEYEKAKCDRTKLSTSRKSFIKKRASILKKRTQQTKMQKEKRLAAYNKIRRISKVDRAVDETYSVGSELNISGATYDLEMGETSYESDILNFQAEVNECQGPVDIIVQHADDEVDFEKLCIAKESECPFVDKKKSTSPLVSSAIDSLSTTSSTKSPKSSGEREIYSNLSPHSINSNFSANSTTRMSSHCARICWNQQKIPKITTYKAEKKSFENDSLNSTQSHNTQTLITTVKSMHSNTAVIWNDLHPSVRYYIIFVTSLVIALLCTLIQLFR